MHEVGAVVVGLGAMGSSTLYQLAKRGVNVVGIDKFEPPHGAGSSTGESRITRQAIGEGAHYTPMALRSYEIFRELEQISGKKLLQITGGLMISSDTKSGGIHVDNFLDETLRAAKKYKIKRDLLDADEIRVRFPQFNIAKTERAYYEYEAGILFPEECIRTQLQLAKDQHAATIITDDAVKSFREESGGSTRVITESGNEFKARKVIICAGPWLLDFIGEQYKRIFKVVRKTLFWFDVEENYFDFLPPKFPIWIWEVQAPGTAMYGFPAINGMKGGTKLATGEFGDRTSPQTIDRTVSKQEIRRMYESQVRPYFPHIGSECLRTAVCMYTTTPDAGFVIDFAPGSNSIIICSPCSGHGFKHSAAVGESIAELVCGSSAVDLNHFRLDRFMVELDTIGGASKVTDSY